MGPIALLLATAWPHEVNILISNLQMNQLRFREGDYLDQDHMTSKRQHSELTLVILVSKHFLTIIILPSIIQCQMPFHQLLMRVTVRLYLLSSVSDTPVTLLPVLSDQYIDFARPSYDFQSFSPVFSFKKERLYTFNYVFSFYVTLDGIFTSLNIFL